MTKARPGGRTARIGNAVMEATLDELADVGHADFSVERVAERAGVNKTTLYRRWGGRDDLIAAAIHSGIPDTQPPADTGTLRGDLMARALGYIAYFDSERARAITRVMNATTEPRLVEARRALFAAREDATRLVYERAVARGELRDMSGVETAITTTLGAVHHQSVMGRALSRSFVERVVDHTLAALGVDTPPHT